MSDILLVRIILPSKIVLEMEADMVNIPSDNGMFGVLPQHEKLVSTIDIGVITLFFREKQTRYFVYGGTAQITGDEVNILSDFAVNLAEENSASVTDNISNLKNDLSDVEVDSIEADIINETIKKYQSLLNFI